MCTTDSIGSIKMNELASNKHALKAKHLENKAKQHHNNNQLFSPKNSILKFWMQNVKEKFH